ncbi:uncharacterized protein PAN0_001d0379 [Moesziomyces antarcticus]|uniref:Related to transmembrane mucin involved in surface sensing via MAP-kinase cascade n=1 Tax=Pseudozyma antarctica TaxID=84753 RepID=A0A5C3FE96_PSEA2|nr:uncharacterized protein PAN0_001d0379 [Moesziomyces antarcticus]GAK62181.1 hypothetical protein PAN0_001d0379 [Moesziomyces antarcticus]SPO42718.1 related to transmembrane mucin involved in surface sensing via MAP-kinase cascade [Moesziomyces antarcticus]
MVAFQPAFKLMLVSLSLVFALANHAHADAGAHAPAAVRRHAGRAARMSKRFPPVAASNQQAAQLDKRQRHGIFGLTPEEIDQILGNEPIDADSTYPASNSTNSTSTSTSTRRAPRTRSSTATDSDSDAPTSTASLRSFALPSANSTSTSHSSSTADPTHSTHSTHSTASSHAPSSTSSRSASSPTSSASSSNDPFTDAGADPTSSSPASVASASPTSSQNVLGGLLGGLLGHSSTTSDAPRQTSTGQQGSDDADTASSTKPAPTATSSANDGGTDGDDPTSSSRAPKQTQPDFYSFTPQAATSSSSSAPSSTGLVGSLLGGLVPSSSASASASPTPSPTGTDSGSDLGSDSDTASSTRTTQSNAPRPTGSADGGSPTDTNTSDSASSTSYGNGSGSSTVSDSPTTTATVTDGPSSTTQDSASVPTATGTATASGSDSGSASSAESSSSSASSDDSASSSASSTATTNPYWYANTQSLKMAPSTTSSAASPAQTGSDSSSSGTTDTSTSASDGSSGSTPALQDLPTTIVPSADSYTQPPDTTSIGLLFKQDMKWTWVISQADLTAQIFAFMPDLVGQSVSLDSSKVSTVKLASYSPETGTGASPASLSTAKTLYMAYVPSSSVEDLQAMIANTSSPFYTSAAPGAPQQLASQVDPTFNILSVAGQVAAGAKQNSTSGSGKTKDDSTLRNSLIGVGCGLAACLSLVAGGVMWRKQRQAKEEAVGGGNAGVSRAQTIRSFSGGLRETWAPDALDQHRALGTGGEMQQVWMADGGPAHVSSGHADGFGGYVAADPFQESAYHPEAAGAYVAMNRSSRMTERSNYSDFSQMTEAQRIQYDYESSRRSFHSSSEHSGGHSENSNESAGMLSTYQEDYRVPRQHTTNHAFGARSNSVSRSGRRRGSVASSTIGRPEMMSNSVLL